MRAWAGAILATGLLVAGCGSAPREPVDVVLIGIDTLRADHLGCYGYGRPTSPCIDALAGEGVLFEEAISQSPWTLPAFASILTGVIPQRHGAGQGKNCLLHPCGALAKDQTVLAELFLRAGYHTAAFVSNSFAGAEGGLGRGFEETECLLSGSLAVDHALAWLERHRTERTFLFVHVIEPHMPYAPPPADAAPFLDPTYAGAIKGYLDYHLLPELVRDDADRRRVVDLYDGEIHAADGLVGRIVDTLTRLDLGGRTVVAIVADHGEELFDRGTLGHGHSLYDELLHVPLLLRFPAGKPRGRIGQQVRTMDLFPTLLEVAGLPVPTGLDGVSLAGLAAGGEAPPATAAALAEFTFSGPELRGLRSAHDKLVLDADRGQARLFDLATDPGEWTDVANDRPERVAALRDALAATDASGKPGFYVFVRAGWHAGRIRVTLTAPGRGFGDVALRYATSGDTVALSPDGRAATVTFTLVASAENGVHVEMRDPVESLTVASVAMDDVPVQVPVIVGTGGTPAARLPLVVSPSQAAVERATPPQPAPAIVVAVQAVAPPSRAVLQFDPETAARLRALGYAQ